MGEPLRVIVEADGGARGNPGPAGYGAVVREAGSGAVLAERAEALGVATNNVAEYSGLIAGLRAAAELGAVAVDVRMDSKLVVEQMCGRWQIKHPGLRPLAAEAATLIRRFDQVSFTWVPRDHNKHADRLANQAMDAAAGPPTPAREPASAGPPTPARQPAPAGVPIRAGTSTSAGERASADKPPADKPTRSWMPPLAPPTRLILVRHGETTLTEQRRFSGRGDAPLSEHGVAQARAAAARVVALAPARPADSAAGTPPDGGRITAVVSSPLSRCVRTAELVAAAAAGGLPVATDDDLVECDFGEWEGLTFAEATERWPDEVTAWLADPAVAPPGGESFHQVGERVRRAVARLRERRPGDTIAVVTHVTPIKLLLRDALAATDALLHRLYLDAAGVSVVDFWADGGVAVRAVNDTAHLPEPPAR